MLLVEAQQYHSQPPKENSCRWGCFARFWVCSEQRHDEGAEIQVPITGGDERMVKGHGSSSKEAWLTDSRPSFIEGVELVFQRAALKPFGIEKPIVESDSIGCANAFFAQWKAMTTSFGRWCSRGKWTFFKAVALFCSVTGLPNPA